MLKPRNDAEALAAWRSWAQFVYLGGGPVTLEDDALQKAVCAAHDKQVAEERDALSTAKVTRFEVIDDRGRTYVQHGCRVDLGFQDAGRTLKAFVSPRSNGTQARDAVGLSDEDSTDRQRA